MTTAASRSVQPLPVATSPAAPQVEAVAATVAPTEPSEAQVVRWLQANPAFFDDQPNLLADLSVRHPLGGKAVSLVERQVDVLREKHRIAEARLAELIRIGQQNDAISERMQQLALDLLSAEDRVAVPALLLVGLTRLFEVPQVALRVWNWPDASAPWAQPADAEMRRRCDSLEGVYCGPKSDFSCVRWLPQAGEQTESIALLALRAPAADRADAIVRGRRPERLPCFGLLVLGSPDAGRFQVGLGTAFLERLADLAGAALSRALPATGSQAAPHIVAQADQHPVSPVDAAPSPG